MAAHDENPREALEQLLRDIAAQVGEQVEMYPVPGRPVRQVVLRDTRDSAGTRYLDAVLEDDGTLRVTGCDEGPGVTEALGRDTRSYEWAWVVAPERVGALAGVLSAGPSDDVLALLAAYSEKNFGMLDALMRNPRVAARFDSLGD